MADPMYLIAATGIDATQRRLIQAFIKEHTAVWWHGLPDVWMVRGQSAKQWREQLGVFVPTAPSGLIVFRMPSEESGQREWSARAQKSTWEWLKESYATPQGGASPAS